jgi:hypothetical protein
MIAIVPVQNLNALAQKALQTAYGLSRRIQVLYVKHENDQRDFVLEWNRHIQTSIEVAGLPEPEVVVLESPSRNSPDNLSCGRDPMLQELTDYPIE